MKRTLQSRPALIFCGVIAGVLLVAASWLFAIGPTLASANDYTSQAQTTQTQNDVLRAKNAALARKMKTIGMLRTKLASAIAALPATSKLPEFTRELTHIAPLSGVQISGISVNGIAPVTDAASSAPSNAPATGTDNTSNSTTGSAAPTTSTAPSASSIYTISISTTTSGPYASQTRFLDAIRAGSRRALVKSAQFSISGGNPRGTSLTTQMTIFSAPMTSAQAAEIKAALKAG